MEAAGVEPITMLTARKLLISGSATRAKKASLPDPLYVYCTKMFSLWNPADAHSDHRIAWIRRAGIEKNTQLPMVRTPITSGQTASSSPSP